MPALWGLLLACASAPGLLIEDGGTAPDWVVAQWKHEGPRLIAALDTHATLLPRQVTLKGSWAAEVPSVLNIRAEAMNGRVRIALAGASWATPTEGARLLLRQNLAHELAHQWQLAAPRAEAEPLWFHEGLAEALALELLAATDLVSAAEQDLLAGTLIDRCGRALRAGRLAEAKDADAIYGCGYVLVSALAAEHGGPMELQRLYARHRGDFTAFLDAAASPPLRRSVVRFREADLTRASTGWAIGALRAGRL